jgi:GNAT superfamily N-acetyltransferase
MTDLLAAVDATWPAAVSHRAGGWVVRDGRGGGNRVSSASPLGPEAATTIELAEAKHAELGQPPLFRLTEDDAALDAALAARGYRIAEPVVILAAPVARLTADPPDHMTSFPIWPPLTVMAALWDEGGIGPARRAVMERASGPKTAILGRTADRAAGAVFVALHGGMAMVHALHVRADWRRKGLGRNLMRAAARWAMAEGADRIALAVARANETALALYAGLGMAPAGHYHYRIR